MKGCSSFSDEEQTQFAARVILFCRLDRLSLVR